MDLDVGITTADMDDDVVVDMTFADMEVGKTLEDLHVCRATVDLDNGISIVDLGAGLTTGRGAAWAKMADRGAGMTMAGLRAGGMTAGQCTGMVMSRLGAGLMATDHGASTTLAPRSGTLGLGVGMTVADLDTDMLLWGLDIAGIPVSDLDCGSGW